MLRLLTSCLLAFALLDFGIEFYLACQNQTGHQVDVCQINIPHSDSPLACLFNQELSECENETSNKYSPQQHMTYCPAYEPGLDSHQIISHFLCSKIWLTVQGSSVNLIIREHRFVV